MKQFEKTATKNVRLYMVRKIKDFVAGTQG
jgi:hypothetical protein